MHRHTIHRLLPGLALACWLETFCGIAGAQRVDAFAVPDAVVRIATRGLSVGEAEEMGLRLYGEAVGVDNTLYLATGEALDRLEQSGVRFALVDEGLSERSVAERARIDAVGLADPLPDEALAAKEPFFADYRPYDQLPERGGLTVLDFVEGMVDSFPGVVSSETIGLSVEGREILGVTVYGPAGGSASDKPMVFVNAGIHAREWISPSSACWMIDRLAHGYGTDDRVTRLLDSVSFFVVPVSNPDGYEYTFSDNRLWRKNRRLNANGSFGVDLNRNFDEAFGGPGSSGWAGSDIYRGPEPFSEPESRAIRDAVAAKPTVAAFVDVHSFSQLILYPFGFTDAVPDEPELSSIETMSSAMRRAMGSLFGELYTDQPSHDLYLASGTTKDWAFAGEGALAWTVELRPGAGSAGIGGFILPPDQIEPTGEELTASMLSLGESVAQAVSFDAWLPAGVPAGRAYDATFRAASLGSAPLDPSTARVWTRTDGGAWHAVPAEDRGGGVFSAELPAVACRSAVDVYYEIETTAGAVYRHPLGAPAAPLRADAVTLVPFDDSFSTDLGWTVSSAASSGAWERGVPQFTGSGEPERDFERDGFAYLTGNVDDTGDVDGGSTTLVSPEFAAPNGAWVTFAYWLNDSSTFSIGDEDFLAVDARVDGGPWSRVRTYQTAEPRWRIDGLTIGVDVPAGEAVQLRFVAADEGFGATVEAAIDALLVTSLDGCKVACPADVNSDGQVGGDDFNAWLRAFLVGSLRADQDGDGLLTFEDFDAWVSGFLAGCEEG
ncbi:MAG: M14 family zinc carboxypeptidase [Planctomycetota bacterium]